MPLSLMIGASLSGGNAAVNATAYNLTVGNGAGSYGFVSASFGAIVPNDLNGIEFQRIVASAGDVAQVGFAGGAQQGTSETLFVTFPDFNSGTEFKLTWNAGESIYEGTVAGFLAFLTAQDGNTIPMFITVVIATALTDTPTTTLTDSPTTPLIG